MLQLLKISLDQYLAESSGNLLLVNFRAFNEVVCPIFDTGPVSQNHDYSYISAISHDIPIVLDITISPNPSVVLLKQSLVISDV